MCSRRSLGDRSSADATSFQSLSREVAGEYGRQGACVAVGLRHIYFCDSSSAPPPNRWHLHGTKESKPAIMVQFLEPTL